MPESSDYYGLGLRNQELENFGRQRFVEMGLLCIGDLNHVPVSRLDTLGSHSEGEHLELDYLIAYGDYCLIGEITGRDNPDSVRNKYRRFRRHFNVLIQSELDENTWRTLGVPNEYLRDFREVEELRGFFISNKLERFDVELSEVENIARFYRSDWKLLVDYSYSVGEYAKPHFAHRFAIEEEYPYEALIRNRDAHHLIHGSNKKIASDVGLADVITFEISPYDLLEIAEVYRRDGLSSLEPAPDYQRPLIPKKLESIRETLLIDPDFMFPSSILVVLSNNCTFRDGLLTIPKQYGAVSVIDGQHRLFSYAEPAVREKVGDESKILVTALRFQDADEPEILRYSAKTFVEINVNQTRVDRNHLDAIAYDILGQTDARALAAKIILEANERQGSSLYGIFDTNRTGLGIIRSITVLNSLRAITNLNRIKRIQNAQSGRSRLRRLGYERLMDTEISRLEEPETLIRHGVRCLEHYFNLVSEVFHHDWPKRQEENNSSLKYAKVIAGFVKLLWKDFFSEGAEWNDVTNELRNIRDHLMELRGLDDYDRILFDPDHERIPDSDPRPNDNYRFLHANRQAPVSILEIVT